MKCMSSLPRTLALTLTALLLLLLLTACVDVFHGNQEDRANGEQFISLLIADNPDEAYRLLHPDTVPAADFAVWWAELRTVAADATTAEITGRGWSSHTENGVTTNEYTYQVQFDNGRTLLLTLFNRKAGEPFVGGTYKDATDFTQKTERTVPVVSVLLTVYSVLALAFTVWMLVDCARSRVKYKPLWIILNIAALSLTFTFGEQATFSFLIGLFLQFSSITDSCTTMTVTLKLVVPVGSLIYLCLRRRLTLPSPVVPPSPAPDATPEASATTFSTSDPTSDP